MRIRTVLFTGCSCALTALQASAGSTLSLTPIVSTGQAAPGEAATFGLFGSEPGGFIFTPPVINQLGQVFFSGTLQQAGAINASNDSGIWIYNNGAITPVAREGSLAPGASGALYGSLISSFDFSVPENSFVIGIRLGGAQQIAYTAPLTGGGSTPTTNSGLWRSSAGSSTLIAREGSPAPGGSAWVDFGFYANISYNGSPTVLLSSATTSGLEGIWSLIPSGGSVIARTGDPAPGTSSTFTGPFSAPRGEEGSLAFLAHLTQGIGGVNASNDGAIWIDNGSSQTIALREGDPAPGISGAAVGEIGFIGGYVPSNGDMVITASLAPGAGVADDTNDCVFARSFGSGVFELLAREGFDAPGAGGADFGFFVAPSLSDNGPLAFLGALQQESGVTFDNDDGIWARFFGSSLELVMREGDPAPLVPGAMFSYPLTPAVTDEGDVAFYAFLRQGVGGVTASNDSGIWIRRASGEWFLVAREGSTLDVDPTAGVDLRVVSGLTLPGGATSADGSFTTAFNHERLVFRATFTDNTQALFVASLQTPAPCAGDTNGDNVVNFADLNAVLSAFGQTGAPGFTGADLNGDGVVNFADLNTVLSAFGSACAG